MVAPTALVIYRRTLQRVRRHELPHSLTWKRFREVELLSLIAPHRRQARHMPVVLDPLDGDLETQCLCEVYVQAHDRVVHYVLPRLSTNDLSIFK
jgi:hypothetical protein